MRKSAIVTGGSSGIGYCVCEELARRDYGVFILARDSRRGEESAARIRAATPDAAVEFIACDVRSAAAVRSAFAEIRSRVESADLLVNCAGVLQRAMLGDLSAEAIDSQLDTCLKGTMLVTDASVELLAGSQSALVVNVGSVAGRASFEGLSVYGAAKAGVIHFSRTAARELYGRGIRVVCVNPGVVETNLMSAAELAMVKATLPSGRLQHPEEVASFIVALTDPTFQSLTGAVIDLDDGTGLFTGDPRPVEAAPRSPAVERSEGRDGPPARAAEPAGESAAAAAPAAAPAAAAGNAHRLKETFQKIFGLPESAVHSELTPDDVFKWDSIGHIRLVGGIEKEFGVSFDVDEIMELDSFRAILEILGRKT